MKTVKETSNYGLFKILNGNRPVSEIHVRKLMDSFITEGYLFSPILVNKYFEVIDGQHRLEAAKRLKLPIYYIQDDNYSLNEVQILNSLNKVWTNVQYLDSFCELNLKPYMQIKEFLKYFPDFTLTAALMIISNSSNIEKKRAIEGLKSDNPKRSGRDKEVFLRTFRQGKFEIKDLQLAYENANKILMIKQYYDGYARKHFVATMITLFKNNQFDFAEFLLKLKQQPTTLVHCANVEQYKLLIEKIYNFRRSKKINLRY